MRKKTSWRSSRRVVRKFGLIDAQSRSLYMHGTALKLERSRATPKQTYEKYIDREHLRVIQLQAFQPARTYIFVSRIYTTAK